MAAVWIGRRWRGFGLEAAWRRQTRGAVGQRGMAARRAGPVLQMTAVVARVLPMTVVVVQMPPEVTFRGSFQKCLPCVLYKTLKICLTCISFEALWSASKGILLKALESALKVHFWRHN